MGPAQEMVKKKGKNIIKPDVGLNTESSTMVEQTERWKWGI